MKIIDKNDYISKLEVVLILQKAYAEGRIKAKDGLSSVLDDIQKADVQPVKRGRWELTNNPNFRKCSECGEWYENSVDMPYYCKKCGADMREHEPIKG